MKFWSIGKQKVEGLTVFILDMDRGSQRDSIENALASALTSKSGSIKRVRNRTDILAWSGDREAYVESSKYDFRQLYIITGSPDKVKVALEVLGATYSPLPVDEARRIWMEAFG